MVPLVEIIIPAFTDDFDFGSIATLNVASSFYTAPSTDHFIFMEKNIGVLSLHPDADSFGKCCNHLMGMIP